MRTELSNEFVKIRRYYSGDIPLLFEAVREASQEVSLWLDWCHPGYSIEEATSWVLNCDETWGNGTEHNFAIFDHDANFLGGVGLNQISCIHQFANLGYWMRSSRIGNGFATAATLLAARFGFEELNLARVEIVVTVDNKASQRVAEKSGAKREGILRKRLVIHGCLHNAVMYSLVAEDLV